MKDVIQNKNATIIQQQINNSAVWNRFTFPIQLNLAAVVFISVYNKKDLF